MNEATAISALAVNQQVGNRYRLTQLLRVGGMGEIYLAEDTRLFDRQVVVKLLSLQAAETDHQLRRWFANEAQISVMLGDHPGIVKVLDFGLECERPYLVMEYLGRRPRGCDLEDYLREKGRLSPQQVVHLGTQICSGLAYAHQFCTSYEDQVIQGVIHRDLKPSNLFILQQEILGETVKILDFGIAKILKTARQKTDSRVGFVGTLSHASPEQLRGQTLTPSSDIYSFGVVLYRMLTGDLPFHPASPSFKEWYLCHTQKQPIPFSPQLSASIPPALESVVLSCLAKDPQDRPASMTDLMHQLQESLQTTPFLRSLPSAPSSAVEAANRAQTTITRLPSAVLKTKTCQPQPNSGSEPKRILADLSQKLVPLLSALVGPIAPILIQETCNETSSGATLIQTLAESVPVPQRAQFLDQAYSMLRQLTPQGQPLTAPRQPSSRSTQTTQRFRAHLTHSLSQLIGPMADLLVEQAITVFPDMTQDQLVDYLTTDLPSGPKVQQFRYEMLSCIE